MCGLAVSVLKISPKEFWDSTPEEIYYALDFSFNELKLNWELQRLQTFYLVNVHLTSETALKSVKDLFKFPWEDKDDKEVNVVEPDWNLLERQL